MIYHNGVDENLAVWKSIKNKSKYSWIYSEIRKFKWDFNRGFCKNQEKMEKKYTYEVWSKNNRYFKFS